MKNACGLCAILFCFLGSAFPAESATAPAPEKKLSVAVTNRSDEAPSRETVLFMTQMHQLSYKAFADTDDLFGAFRIPPMLTTHSLIEFNRNTFERVELIGMTRPEPVAYSYFRQRMGRGAVHMLKPQDVIKRPVSDFEKRAIVELTKGRDVVIEAENPRIPPPEGLNPDVVKAAGKAIYAVGALYARKSCLDCHEVREGTILGALTYRVGTNFVTDSIKRIKEKDSGAPIPTLPK